MVPLQVSAVQQDTVDDGHRQVVGDAARGVVASLGDAAEKTFRCNGAVIGPVLVEVAEPMNKSVSSQNVAAPVGDGAR